MPSGSKCAELRPDRLEQVLAQPRAGRDRQLGIVGHVGDAVVIGDLGVEHVAHEEVLGQAHPAKILER